MSSQLCTGNFWGQVMFRLYGFCLIVFCFFPVFASAQQPGVRLELNKLEDVGEACRIYLLIEEQSDVNFQKLDADFVLFDGEGIIIKRYLVPLAPIDGGQSRVRLFDLPNSSCAQIDGILFNGTINCVSDGEEKCPVFDLSSKDRNVRLF